MSDKKRAPKKVAINYQNGKIYKIVNDVNDMVYIGSTTQPLSKRMSGHRHAKYTSRFYTAVKDIGIGHFQIILVELFPCTCKAELEAREYAVMNGFAKEKLYNSIIDGKFDDASKQKMRESSAAKGKFGAESAPFKRGSVMEFKRASGDAGFQFQWFEDGKKRKKTFSYGLVRTYQMAYEACVAFQNQIYPLPILEEKPVVE